MGGQAERDMHVKDLTKTAQAIVAKDRGLIAVDESVAICKSFVKSLADLNSPILKYVSEKS